MAPVPEPPPDLTDGEEAVPPESPAEGVLDDDAQNPPEPAEPG